MSIGTSGDLKAIGAYLEAHVAGFRGLERAEPLTGGQSNPTFKLFAKSGVYVLRRQPYGELLPSAHAVDREYRVLSVLAQTDVPVAEVYHLCTDPSVLGSQFYVMAFVDGRTFWDPTLPSLEPETRHAVYDTLNRTLVAIHLVDVDAVGLGDFGKPGNYFERQFSRWTRQYRASITEPIEAMEHVIEWLDAHMVPDDGRRTLVHGDYRLDNVLLHPTSSDALAVMDWELATLGHPFADLAYQCMLWRMPQGPILSGLGDLDRAALGLPTEAAYVARYCERMGLAGIDGWPFYLVFGLFRLAAILEGVRKRALMGNAADARALEAGALVVPLAEKAREIIVTEGA